MLSYIYFNYIISNETKRGAMMKKPECKTRKSYGFSILKSHDWMVVLDDKIESPINFKVSAYAYAKYHGFRVSVRRIIDDTGYIVERV